MKLNLGCGFNKLDGYLNVDCEPLCQPDCVADLEEFPWPWADESVDEIVASHCLEHVGATSETWIGILKEIWRVCKPGAHVAIMVPHPRHENFMHDPTHVRVITPIGIAMFSQERNLADLRSGGQETKLGLFSGIDLEVVDVGYDLMEPWRSALASGERSREQVEWDLEHMNNVCYQTRILVRVVKPGRGEDWIRERNSTAAGLSPNE